MTSVAERIAAMPAEDVSALLARTIGWTPVPAPHRSADTMIVLLEWAAREHGIVITSHPTRWPSGEVEWRAFMFGILAAPWFELPNRPEAEARALLHALVERGAVTLEQED